MRKIIAVAALLTTQHAAAQSQFYYDANGRQLGYSVQGGSGSTFYYGANGQQLGNSLAVPQTGSTYYYGPPYGQSIDVR